MKNWVRWTLVFLLGQAALVAGAGKSHGAEVVVMYMNYLAEEELGATSFEIAPGCVGSREGSRCTFKEFLMHIWSTLDKNAPNPLPRPTTVKGFSKNLEDPLSSTIGQITQDLTSATVDVNSAKVNRRKQPIPYRLVDAIDIKLVKPSATGNFYDLMETMSDELSELGNRVAGAPSDQQRKILEMGKAAFQSSIDLRLKETEERRLPYLKDVLGYMPSTRTITVGNGFTIQFESLDPVQNEKDNGLSVANLKTQTDTYAGRNAITREHDNALQSVRRAGQVLGCSLRI